MKEDAGKRMDEEMQREYARIYRTLPNDPPAHLKIHDLLQLDGKTLLQICNQLHCTLKGDAAFEPYEIGVGMSTVFITLQTQQMHHRKWIEISRRYPIYAQELNNHCAIVDLLSEPPLGIKARLPEAWEKYNDLYIRIFYAIGDIPVLA